MKNALKTYFTFSATDRKGIIVLCGVLILLLILPQFFPIYLTRPPENFDAFSQDLAKFRQQLTEQQADAQQEWAESRKQYRRYTSFAENGYYDREYEPRRRRYQNFDREAETTTTAQAFAFDPNQLTYEQGVQLGLSPKLSRTIVNYLEKGGRFGRKEDLKKIYGMTEADYKRLEPYIQLPETTTAAQTFAFDPNQLTYEQGVQLGLSPKLSRTIVNYLEKGGRFRRKEDLKKIYGMTEADYQRLEPYIQLPETTTAAQTGTDGVQSGDIALYETASEQIVATEPQSTDDLANKQNSSETKTPKDAASKIRKNPNAKIDINAADTIAWQQLPGIGSSRAKSIVRFRDALGGFANIEQVGETRGLDPETFAAIKGNLLNPNASSLRPININIATQEELSKHPYIDSKTAAIIVKYRKQHGKFAHPTDVKKVGVIDNKQWQKLLPYLSTP
ncbi:MAG: helix-hairpin-helix domain-containing protein [Chitinophagales bacterium]|nr:helix-hairpin-helix domain-containing protein [Chitinophagales bacterium]